MKCFQFPFLFAAAVLIISSSRLFSADDALKESEKKSYKTDATYTEIAEDPEKFIKKDPKRCMKAIYNGYITKLPPPYEKILPKFICLLKIENIQKECPLIFSSKNEKLMKDIATLEQDQLITLYATIQQKVEKDDSKAGKIRTPKVIGKHYYLLVDDIDISTSSKDSVKTEKNSVEPTDFGPVKYRLVDIQPKNFIDKNISFKMRFKDISNTIPAQIVKYAEISNDEYFVLLPMDTFSLPILIKRDNENCVPTIVDSELGSLLNLCGTVRSIGDLAEKSNKPMFYIILMSASIAAPPPPASAKPQPPAVPNITESKQPPPPAPAPAPAPQAQPLTTPPAQAPAPAVIPEKNIIPAPPPSTDVQDESKNTKTELKKEAEKTEAEDTANPASKPPQKKVRKYIPSTE